MFPSLKTPADAPLAQAIGQFIVEFSNLEMAMRITIARFLQLPDYLHETLFAQITFAGLGKILRALSSHQLAAQAQAIDALLTECESLHDHRNKFAHGTWAYGASEVAAFLNPASVPINTTYTPEKLQALTQTAIALRSRLLKALEPMMLGKI